jgi:hypothetical protein
MHEPKDGWGKIISLDKITKSLALKKDDFIEAVKEKEIQLIILTKQYLDIGIRHNNQIKDSSKKLPQDNPLSITVSEADGFIPHPRSNAKTLHTLNWKHCEPLGIVKTDEKGEFAQAFTPASIASSKTFSQCQIEYKEIKYVSLIAKMVGSRIEYTNQVFFFKGKDTYNTELSMKEIYITTNDLDILKEYLSNLHKPDFNDVGGYQENPWSNQLIKDINAIHKYILDNKMIGDDSKKKVAEVKAREWLQQRYDGNNKLSKECFNQLPKIVSDQINLNIDFEKVLEKDIKHIKERVNSKTGSPLVAALHEKRKRNREKATDVIILIDIAAEKHFEEKKKHKDLRKTGSKGEATNIDHNYTNRDKFLVILEEAGIKKDVVRQAIFSTIKRKLSEVN